MFKYVVVILAVIACVAAKPGLLAYTSSAAIVALPAPIITATSSQVIARNYNGIVTTPVVAPVADIPIAVKSIAVAPITAAAYTAPVAAYRTPIVARAYSSPVSYALW